MGEDPRQIRREIEQTRERMTDTVEAIGYRADVRTRAKDAIINRKDTIVNKASGVVDRVVGSLPDAPSSPDLSLPDFVPDREQLRRGAQQGLSVAQRNPLGLGVGAVAAGFLLGMLLPSTRAEDERVGDLADQLKAEAREVGQEALEHGKQVAKDAAQSASEAVQESGQKHGEQLADSLRESVEDVRAS
jgi:gas vesicle protein